METSQVARFQTSVLPLSGGGGRGESGGWLLGVDEVEQAAAL